MLGGGQRIVPIMPISCCSRQISLLALLRPSGRGNPILLYWRTAFTRMQVVSRVLAVVLTEC